MASWLGVLEMNMIVSYWQRLLPLQSYCCIWAWMNSKQKREAALFYTDYADAVHMIDMYMNLRDKFPSEEDAEDGEEVVIDGEQNLVKFKKRMTVALSLFKPNVIGMYSVKGDRLIRSRRELRSAKEYFLDSNNIIDGRRESFPRLFKNLHDALKDIQVTFNLAHAGLTIDTLLIDSDHSSLVVPDPWSFKPLHMVEEEPDPAIWPPPRDDQPRTFIMPLLYDLHDKLGTDHAMTKALYAVAGLERMSAEIM